MHSIRKGSMPALTALQPDWTLLRGERSVLGDDRATSQQRGKPRRVGGAAGLRPRWKKAIVTLRAGDTIEIFEG